VENKPTLMYVTVVVDLCSFHSCKFGFTWLNNVGTSQLTQDNIFAVWNKPSQCHGRNPSNYTEVTPPINPQFTSPSLHAPVIWCSSRYVRCYMPVSDFNLLYFLL